MSRVTIPVPEIPYKCIVADPPWTYANRWVTSPTRTFEGRTGAAAHYPTLTLDEVKGVNISEIVDHEGSVLFLWATMPLLKDALSVMDCWGYTYKTSLCWTKTRWLGMGKWFRTNTELCLVGILGKVRAFNSQKSNVIFAQPSRHSRKPPEFFDLIDPIIRHYELVPCIELFAREKRPQWASWGNETELGEHND